VKLINTVLDNSTENFDNCKIVLDFDKSVTLSNNFFNESKFDLMNTSCDEKFNIKNLKLDENYCSDIIRYNKENFEEDFVILKDFDNKKKECISKYLVTTFSTGSLFNVENDFKS
jgi:hypothetical protein